MSNFLLNLFRLARPLSNVKNIALIILAMYISKTSFSLPIFLWVLFSASLVCSAFYVFNTLSDADIDRNNENKKHYLEALKYFGEDKAFIIFIVFLSLGLLIGYFINLYFFICLLLLALANFLYSSKYTRFKERIILDVIFGASLTFFFRFLAFWFAFTLSFPPVLVLAGLIFAKSGGYFLYKSLDATYLSARGIKNSVTVLNLKGRGIFSAVLFAAAFICFEIICLSGILPMKLSPFILFIIPPIIIAYLSYFGKIKTSVKKLRVAGYIYWIIVLIIISPFL